MQGPNKTCTFDGSTWTAVCSDDEVKHAVQTACQLLQNDDDADCLSDDDDRVRLVDEGAIVATQKTSCRQSVYRFDEAVVRHMLDNDYASPPLSFYRDHPDSAWYAMQSSTHEANTTVKWDNNIEMGQVGFKVASSVRQGPGCIVHLAWEYVCGVPGTGGVPRWHMVACALVPAPTNQASGPRALMGSTGMAQDHDCVSQSNQGMSTPKALVACRSLPTLRTPLAFAYAQGSPPSSSRRSPRTFTPAVFFAPVAERMAADAVAERMAAETPLETLTNASHDREQVREFIGTIREWSVDTRMARLHAEGYASKRGSTGVEERVPLGTLAECFFTESGKDDELALFKDSKVTTGTARWKFGALASLQQAT